MELRPRSSDGLPHASLEYQCLQGTKDAAPSYYNVGFARGENEQEDYDDLQTYAEIGNAQ